MTNASSLIDKFNALFMQDVDQAYDYLRQELHNQPTAQSRVAVRLGNGQQISVNVGQ